MSKKTKRQLNIVGYSPDDVATNLGTCVRFIRDEIYRKHLIARRLGRRWVILDEDLREYLNRRKTQ